MIYFAQATYGGPIKIGSSCQIKTRLGALTRKWGESLKVLAVMEGGLKAERDMHSRFNHLLMIKEWFCPGEDLLQFIAEHGKPWDGKDELGPSSITLSVCFDIDVHEAICEAAKTEGRSFSSVVNRALREYFGLPLIRPHASRRTKP